MIKLKIKENKMAKNKESFPNYKDRQHIPLPMPNSEEHILSIKKILSNPPLLKKEEQMEMQLELPSQIDYKNNKMREHEERMKKIRENLSKNAALQNNKFKEIEEIELPKKGSKDSLELEKHEERIQNIKKLLKK